MANLDHYGWTDAVAPQSASFIDPVLLQELSKAAPRSARVIELGSGNGALAQKLSTMGYQVTAIEPSSDGIAQATRAASPVRFVQASIYDDLSASLNEVFDVAISTEVIEHLTMPKELFARASTLLKSQGTLLLSTPYHGYLKNLALSVANGWDRHFHVDWEGGHIKFFSNATLARMAGAYGFTNIRFRGAGRLPYLWKSTIMICTRP